MANKQDQRTKKREIFCTIGITGRGWIGTPTRNLGKCDATEILPEKFYIPEKGKAVSDAYTYPAPALVGNEALTIHCSQEPWHPVGESVTVSAAAYVSPIQWATASGLESWQIRHLNTIANDVLNAWLANNWDNPSAIVDYLRFSNTQAQLFSDEYGTILSELNVLANKKARAVLSCDFLSLPVSAVCPIGTVVVEDPCLGAIRLQSSGTGVYYPAGYKTSKTSVEQATALAQADADASIVCQFVNLDEIVLDCCDTSYLNAPAGISFALVKSTDVVVFKPGEITSSSSSGFLGVLRDLRQALLKCLCAVTDIITGETTYEENCADALDDEVCNEEHVCTCPEGASARLLVIPACKHRSPTLEEANALAEAECSDLIVCTWCNSAQVADCTGLNEITVAQGIVQAGEVCSDVSQEDADSEAKELADERAQCAEACPSDCFCGTADQAVTILSGGSGECNVALGDADAAKKREVRQEQLRDALRPCGVAPLPWGCSQSTMEARSKQAKKSGTAAAKMAAAEMAAKCIEKQQEIALALQNAYACAEPGTVCWETADVDPAAMECQCDCECMTVAQAQAQGGGKKCSDAPCGMVTENKISVPQYCFKTNDGGGGGGGGGGGKDQCPAGCGCMAKATAELNWPNGEYVQCSTKRCYRDKKTKTNFYCFKSSKQPDNNPGGGGDPGNDGDPVGDIDYIDCPSGCECASEATMRSYYPNDIIKKCDSRPCGYTTGLNTLLYCWSHTPVAPEEYDAGIPGTFCGEDCDCLPPEIRAAKFTQGYELCEPSVPCWTFKNAANNWFCSRARTTSNCDPSTSVPCTGGCECLTPEEAAKKFPGGSIQNGESPCCADTSDSSKNRYCYKADNTTIEGLCEAGCSCLSIDEAEETFGAGNFNICSPVECMPPLGDTPARHCYREIPSDGGATPSCGVGSLMVSDGTSWVCLPPPGSPSSHQIIVLTGNGTTIGWQTLTGVELTYCGTGGVVSTGWFIPI